MCHYSDAFLAVDDTFREENEINKCFFLLSDSLHQVLSEFSVVHPVRTNSEGRLLSTSVTDSLKRHEDARTRPGTPVRNRRQAEAEAPSKHSPPTDTPPIGQGGPGGAVPAEEAELFYNVTVFGHELHLRLHPNTHLVAPRATMEWWEESGRKSSQPIEDTHCFYTGEVSNVEDTSVAISNCDGLVGVTGSFLPSSSPSLLF